MIRGGWTGRGRPQEVHDVTVLHDVLLALDADFAGVAAGLLRAERHVVVVLDDLGADESPFEVGVDDAGRLGSLHAADVGPGARLVGACGEEGLEVEQPVGRLDEARHARLLESEVFKEHLALLVALQFGDVGLGGGGDDEHLGLLVGDGGAHRLGIGVARRGALFIDVAYVEHRLVGQQVEVCNQLAVLLVEFDRAGTFALLQYGLVLQQQFDGALGLLVTARGGRLLRLRQAVLDGFEVLELELRVDDFLVAHGVDGAVHVGDVAVVEAAQHVDDGIRVPDVAQELVAQTFALRGTLDQTGDVDDFDGGGDDPFGVVDFGQADEPLVGYGDDAHVGLDGAEGEVGCLSLRVGQAVEKRRFADIGQSDDAAL